MSYNLQSKNHCYIITGGPGSGKTTLIEALALQGYKTVAEVGRQIIQHELVTGGNAIHTGDRLAFRDKMLLSSVNDFDEQSFSGDFVFFDRGVPDLIGYSYLIDQPIPESLQKATDLLRYNPKVFIAPPWEAIYQHDAERKQDFKEAIATYQAIKKGYLENAYSLIELPETTVENRMVFVRQHLAK